MRVGWVLEGSLAGFLGCHKIALEWVCGADFSWKLMCVAGPGDLGGSRGPASAENPGKTRPKISGQIAFRYPGRASLRQAGPSFAPRLSRVMAVGPCRLRRRGPTRITRDPHDTEGGPTWLLEGSLAGDFRPGFPWDFRPKPAPGTPLGRRGPPRTSASTRNQPRRPSLRPKRRG